MKEKKDKIIIESREEECSGDEGAKETTRVLPFSLGGENYCIGIKEAMEIVKLPAITKVPNTPNFILGVINLHGKIITLIDIRYFFGLEGPKRIKDERVIVTDLAGDLAAILVDKVKGTIDINVELIQPPLATIKGELAEYTKGEIQIDNEILILLDLAKILNCEEIHKRSK